MIANRKLLLNKMKEKGDILSDDEAFDFYVEYVMKNEPSCKYLPYANRGSGLFEDYQLWELEQKARAWHRMAIGQFVLIGRIGVKI